jgi:hypothetical protein
MLIGGLEQKIGLMRLGPTGVAIAPPYTIARGPSDGGHQLNHALAPAGRDVAVAWLSDRTEPGRILLALVRP